MTRTGRILLWLLPLGLAASALGQGSEVEEPDHDPLGFPITFNDEIITRSDVLRSMGITNPDVLGSPRELKKARDQVLFERLLERVADLHGITVSDRQLNDELQAEADRKGGEAQLFESLLQAGQSFEEYREEKRRQILSFYFEMMLMRGFTPEQKLLPWNLWPTPQEVRTAFETDRARTAGIVRVRALDFVIRMTKAERDKLVIQLSMGGKSEEWLEEQQSKILTPRLEAIRKELAKGTPFEQIAASQGSDVEAQKERWIPINEEMGKGGDPRVAFLREGPLNQPSPAFSTAGGEFRFFCVLERDDGGSATLQNPEIYQKYRVLIHQIRARRAGALIKIQALDSSTIEPDRIGRELRDSLLAELRDSVNALRSLGIH